PWAGRPGRGYPRAAQSGLAHGPVVAVEAAGNGVDLGSALAAHNGLDDVPVRHADQHPPLPGYEVLPGDLLVRMARRVAGAAHLHHAAGVEQGVTRAVLVAVAGAARAARVRVHRLET